MTSWIALAVVAQFLAAGVALSDKYIVTSAKGMSRPFVYAFYTCLLSGAWVAVFAIGLLPLKVLEYLSVPSFANIEAPTLLVAALSILSAYSFFIALVSLYTALRTGDASDVIPVSAAVSAVATAGLSYALLHDRLPLNFFFGVVLLALGTFLVSRFRFGITVALSVIHAGCFFALHYVTMKGIFNVTNFDNGFFWSRVGFILVALSLLLVPDYLAKIRATTRATSASGGLIILATKFIAGISTLLILKATALGDVSVVQALGGLQFIFLLGVALFLNRNVPLDCRDNITCTEDRYHKALFIGIITIGFVILFL